MKPGTKIVAYSLVSTAIFTSVLMVWSFFGGGSTSALLLLFTPLYAIGWFVLSATVFLAIIRGGKSKDPDGGNDSGPH